MTTKRENEKKTSVRVKAEVESSLTSRFGDAVRRHESNSQFMSTGVAEIDDLSGGVPRGAITEILGPASSGRTSLMLAIIAAATSRDEVCALIDATDSLDAVSAQQAGVDLYKLLWVRCGGNVEHALKATDLLLQGGGFGLVALDLGDISTPQARKLQATWWLRFRRAIEKTPTVVLVIEREPCARSGAGLVFELKRESAQWSSAVAESAPGYGTHSTLLSGFSLTIEHRKPVRAGNRTARIQTRATYLSKK